MSCTFINDNNVTINLINSQISNIFRTRDKHEIIFRKINTYLINNKTIRNNIIDLGAWIGDNSIPWAKNIEGIVYAIDPSPDNISFIKDTCTLNNINNIKCIQKAISDKNQQLQTNDDINHCSFVYGLDDGNGKLNVDSVSLDHLYDTNIIDNIGYIHLDAEGLEYKIIRGSGKIIEKFNPIISFEQHLELDNYNVIITHLKEKKYNVFMIDEILPGCRPDCRNFFAFPHDVYNETVIQHINTHIGMVVMILQ
jgi:FkbM family methyltransferase